MTKLTLSVDEAVVEHAKRIAERNGTSVSAMFTQFVRSMAEPPSDRDKIGPLTRKATGLAQFPDGKSDRELLEDALAEKHGLAR